MIFRLWRLEDGSVMEPWMRDPEPAGPPAHPPRPERNPPENAPPAERPIPSDDEPTPESADNEI